MLKNRLELLLKDVPGKAGFYYKNLKTGETIGFNENEPFIAASVIKIPVFIEVLKQIEEGKLSADDLVEVKEQDKMPSCGALTYMHDGLKVTIKDLYTLMIIHSDNTATNMLIKIAGIDNINNTTEELGCNATKLNRLLFDEEEQKRGKENYITPYEMGYLLERVYNRDLISPYISEEISRVLKLQRINHKIPYLLPDDLVVGHKTGEDQGITHDVGIIYGRNPFIFCFASNETNVVKAENALREMALICYEET
ncbi:MAG TPA: serine hydrolase [Tissierellia bacterium]|nr:serine hydrolase [Tissierellia bacterium]